MRDIIHRHNLDLLMNRGRVAQRDGRPRDALKLFAEAAAVFPEAPEPAFAHCIAALEDVDPRAADLLRRLLVKFPAYAPGWETLGFRLLESNKAEAALACLGRAAAVAPSGRLALARGEALRSLGRVREAREAFKEASRMAPTSARAAFLLGVCAQDARDYAEARAGYERALAIDPESPEAWMNLGTVLQESGDLEGAKRAYGAAICRRGDAFGRVSQALAASPKGELWLDLGRLRRDLAT